MDNRSCAMQLVDGEGTHRDVGKNGGAVVLQSEDRTNTASGTIQYLPRRTPVLLRDRRARGRQLVITSSFSCPSDNAPDLHDVS